MLTIGSLMAMSADSLRAELNHSRNRFYSEVHPVRGNSGQEKPTMRKDQTNQSTFETMKTYGCQHEEYFAEESTEPAPQGLVNLSGDRVKAICFRCKRQTIQCISRS